MYNYSNKYRIIKLYSLQLWYRNLSNTFFYVSKYFLEFFPDFIFSKNWTRLCLCHALSAELQERLKCKPNPYYPNNYANQTWVVVFGTADDRFCVLSKAKIVSQCFTREIQIQLHIMTLKIHMHAETDAHT